MRDMIHAMTDPGQSHHISMHCDPVAQANVVWPSLAHLKATYPTFESWFWNKVVPGLESDTRRIFQFGPSGGPLGVAIAKRERDEAKICTVWIAESERGRGLARSLMEEAVDWLETARPLFTVPAERYAEFQPLVRRFGFEESARIPSLYRSGVIEHIYNMQSAPHS